MRDILTQLWSGCVFRSDADLVDARETGRIMTDGAREIFELRKQLESLEAKYRSVLTNVKPCHVEAAEQLVNAAHKLSIGSRLTFSECLKAIQETSERLAKQAADIPTAGGDK